MATARTAFPAGGRAALLRALAVACIAGAGVRAAPKSKAAAADSFKFGSFGPGGYADYPMDVDEPLDPEEMEQGAVNPEVPEDPVDSPVPAPAPGPGDLPAGAASITFVSPSMRAA